MDGIETELEKSVSKQDSVKNCSYIYLFIKRAFDIIVSLIVFIILLPLFLVLAILIKIDSKGKVFYMHKRIGKNGKIIYLYKFRSMYSDADERLKEMLKDPKIKEEWEENYKIDNDPRITRVGKILRRTSIDELPQLLNIIKGDMSIVGPRPLVEDEIKKYGKNKEKFLSVTPGLTGWWACNGRSCRTYKDRMKLELYYVDHRSLWLDIKVIFMTVGAVIRGHGAK